eukprot:TRINITY_DN74635_c0_g1_i1.p1 TRINITY_DN74635_c0_g1~~TRINITY_DN74635_c0_g1_i1.p1  ORF type:complete len:326 (+),score=40.33 TRINITY_DN74635_c0_g1_i1:54-980(+)
MASVSVAALGDAVWAIAQLASPRCVGALSIVSPTMSAVFRPASAHTKRSREYSRKLQQLPFCYGFSLPPLGLEVLKDTLEALRRMQTMRRREIVGHGAGWAPTEFDQWEFSSSEELQSVVDATKTALSVVKGDRSTVLLLGAVLRLVDDQPEFGQCVTTSVGLEWIDGPAADPLQLGLRLVFTHSNEWEVDLELGSGGWSPWAETWSIRDGTLDARVAVTPIVQLGEASVVITHKCNDADPELAHANDRLASLFDGGRSFKDALVEAGDKGIRAVVCIAGLGWRKDPPAWCPAEVRRLTQPVSGSNMW